MCSMACWIRRWLCKQMTMAQHDALGCSCRARGVLQKRQGIAVTAGICQLSALPSALPVGDQPLQML